MAEGHQEVSSGGAAPMCANGCGFFGSAATKNLCSKCYKDHLVKTTHAAAAAAPVVVDEKKKIEVAQAASAAHVMPEQLLGGHQDPDATATAAVVATPVAQAPPTTSTTEKENAGPVETPNKEEESSVSVGGGGAIGCANACGFFGSAATNNMCSSCYKDFLENVHAAPAVADKVVLAAELQPAAAQISAATTTSSAAPAVKAAAAANRYASCRKKVGLLGFPCRCGGTFCSLHRYAGKHACDFDFKTADREKIVKNNPLVVAAKLNKI